MKNFFKNNSCWLVFLLLLIFIPQTSMAAEYQYDLGISNSDVFFSKDTLIVGEEVRVYGVVHNYGQKDVSGYVSFYQSDQLIGDSQVISVRAGGLSDEVFVDWVVPAGTFNIRTQIKGQFPGDENPDNDSALTNLVTSDFDTDQDGTPDGSDLDDDNDGLADEEEVSSGTSSTNPDSDNDGVNDKEDAFPLDKNKSAKPEAQPLVVKAATPAKSVAPESVLGMKIGQEPVPPAVLEEEEKTAKPPIEFTEDFSSILKVGISYIQKDWRTFVFTANVNRASASGLNYEWNFGDNALSNQKTAEHAFGGPGKYFVSLLVSDGQGDIAQDKIKIEISFFHFANWRLWLVVAGLIVLAVVIFILSRYIRPSEPVVISGESPTEASKPKGPRKRKLDL